MTLSEKFVTFYIVEIKWADQDNWNSQSIPERKHINLSSAFEEADEVSLQYLDDELFESVRIIKIIREVVFANGQYV